MTLYTFLMYAVPIGIALATLWIGWKGLVFIYETLFKAPQEETYEQ